MTAPAPGPARFAFAVFAAILALGACARAPIPVPVPSGTMDVLGPVPAFEPNALPLDWVIEGVVGRGQLAVVERDGVPALRVINGPDTFFAAKPTRASLLATPYLSWAWNIETLGPGIHPVRLMIGFRGGNAADKSSGPRRLVWPGRVLPAHDRALIITWEQSALQRGTITLPGAVVKGGALSRYTARGGRENAGQWWHELLDLSDIYRRSWPGDEAADVRITFIGFGASAGKPAGATYLAGIRLSR